MRNYICTCVPIKICTNRAAKNAHAPWKEPHFPSLKHNAVLAKGVLPVHGLVLKLGHDPQVIYIAIHLGGAEVAGLVPLRTLPVLLVVCGPS